MFQFAGHSSWQGKGEVGRPFRGCHAGAAFDVRLSPTKRDARRPCDAADEWALPRALDMALTKNARHGARQHSVGVVQPCDAADNRAHNTDHDACHTPCNIKTVLQRIQPVVGVQHTTTGCHWCRPCDAAHQLARDAVPRDAYQGGAQSCTHRSCRRKRFRLVCRGLGEVDGPSA